MFSQIQEIVVRGISSHSIPLLFSVEPFSASEGPIIPPLNWGGKFSFHQDVVLLV